MLGLVGRATGEPRHRWSTPCTTVLPGLLVLLLVRMRPVVLLRWLRLQPWLRRRR